MSDEDERFIPNYDPRELVIIPFEEMRKLCLWPAAAVKPIGQSVLLDEIEYTVEGLTGPLENSNG